MPPVLYRCPNTGLQVQGFFADAIAEGEETYETIVCTACRQIHLVNLASGKVLSADDE
jgi:hypothetical protein